MYLNVIGIATNIQYIKLVIKLSFVLHLLLDWEWMMITRGVTRTSVSRGWWGEGFGRIMIGLYALYSHLRDGLVLRPVTVYQSIRHQQLEIRLQLQYLVRGKKFYKKYFHGIFQPDKYTCRPVLTCTCINTEGRRNRKYQTSVRCVIYTTILIMDWGTVITQVTNDTILQFQIS